MLERTTYELLNLCSTNILSVITPKNYFSERQRVIEVATKTERFVNPIFVYGEAIPGFTAKINATIKGLRNSRPCQNKSDAFVFQLIIDRLEKAQTISKIQDSIAARDDESTNSLIEKYYGGPTSEKIIDLAYDAAKGIPINNPILTATKRILDNKTSVKYQKAGNDAREIASKMSSALKMYDLRNSCIIINDSHSAITVEFDGAEHKHNLYIPTSRKVSRLKLIELIGHEVECHMRHNANCAWLLEKFFDVPSRAAAALVSEKDTTLTEGFAKISDAKIHKMGTGTDAGVPKPWYILAALLASDGLSFAEVADYLHEAGNSIEMSWQYTYRVFRGCTNVANNLHSFACQADRRYLDGYVRAIDAIEAKSSVFDYAKFSEDELKNIEGIIGIQLHTIRPAFPFLGIAEQALSSSH